MFRTIKIIIGLISLIAMNANAQVEQIPDWPCIQQFVEEVAPAVIWAGPDPTPFASKWQEAPHVVNLVRQLTDDSDSESLDYHKLISEFSSSLPTNSKNEDLTSLFYGVWETFNDRRKRYMRKIIKYAKHQREVSYQLANLLEEIENFDTQSDAAQQAEEFQELEERVNWHMRIFDKREKAIIFLCERPILIEERLGEVARAIYSVLD